MGSNENLQAQKAVRSPRQDRAREKKARVVEAAYRLFEIHPYDAVTMRMIAREAGVSLGTPYAYFRDKKDIFKAVLVRYGADLNDAVNSQMEHWLNPDTDFEQAVYTLILGLMDLVKSHRNLQKETIKLSLSDDEIRDFFSAGELASAGSLIGRFLEEHGEAQALSDREAAVFLVHKTMDQIVEYLVFFEVDIDEERVLRELARMIAGYVKGRA